jgi:hypothetical protein
MLFADKERTRTEAMKPGENDYSFYDSSARPEFQVYRDLLTRLIHDGTTFCIVMNKTG